MTSNTSAGKRLLAVAIIISFLIIIAGAFTLRAKNPEQELSEAPNLIPKEEVVIEEAPTPEEMEEILDTPQRVILGEYTITAYCPCQKCSEGWGRKTASGATAKAGRTIATDSDFAFGTKLWIEGLGTYVVEDRGGAVKGNHIDIFFDTHQEAVNFGKQTLVVAQVYA